MAFHELLFACYCVCFHLSSYFGSLDKIPNFLAAFVFAGSHAALPEEVHWQSVFPNTPMPKALKDLLPPAGNKNPSIDWNKPNFNTDRNGNKFRVSLMPVRDRSVGIVTSLSLSTTSIATIL
ncbi:Uncharacterized protein TCM_040813 [Theobroma cacao]|uniref:Uncharacterized protein n=1 Tax=Theobroma cacao TaxID=3641 RepID=A0A061GTH1_THECC|nr:Uncharacterized protein TCM_040813 [Theobroma cacao]